MTTATINSNVGTSNVNAAVIPGSKPAVKHYTVTAQDTLPWGRCPKLHHIKIVFSDMTPEGNHEEITPDVLKDFIMTLESIQELEVRELEGRVWGVFTVNEEEDLVVDPLVVGYKVAIDLFMQGCREMLAQRDGKGSQQQRQPRSQGSKGPWNVAYNVLNIFGQDMARIEVRPGENNRFQAVNVKGQVVAEGRSEFCNGYRDAVMAAREFQAAKGHAGGQELRKVKGSLENAKILRKLAFTWKKELSEMLESPIIAEAIALAQEAADHWKGEIRKREAVLLEVSLEILGGANYRDSRKNSHLQDAVRKVVEFANRFKVRSLSDWIAAISTSTPGKDVIPDDKRHLLQSEVEEVPAVAAMSGRAA